MSYLIFARKYRPQKFDEIIGQKHITQTLTNALLFNRIHHAYLFAGPKGTGKTTTARVFAKSLNCETGITPNPCDNCINCKEIKEGSSLDVIEIDGASNRGIDEIRELRERVKYNPAKGRYRIFIIDEVHMLTEPAFNALLKTLEEPPPHVIFIFATTEIHKIPSTITSRCQIFHFRVLGKKEILGQLNLIVKKESIQIERNALDLIFEASSGSLRDAESILDQVVAYSGEHIKAKDVMDVLGISSQLHLYSFAENILKENLKGALNIFEEVVNEGKDISQFGRDLIGYLRNLLMFKIDPTYPLSGMSSDIVDSLKKQSGHFTEEALINLIETLIQTLESIKSFPSLAKSLFELGIVKICRYKSQPSILELWNKIQKLDQNLKELAPSIEPELKTEKIQASIAQQDIEKEPEIPSKPQIIPLKSMDKNILWDQILDYVRENSSPFLEHVLKDATIEMEENVLIIQFDKDSHFQKELIEKNQSHINAIQSACKNILGKSLQLRIITKKKPLKSKDEKKKMQTKPEPDTPKPKENIDKQLQEKEKIDMVLNILGGKIISK